MKYISEVNIILFYLNIIFLIVYLSIPLLIVWSIQI